ncbi:MAG TPA: AraC family transcriptional regulator [Clostridiaceae bacterium]|nr:AraC family transcriptional regulator [Clostridiaceae bacterium]
MYKLKDLLHSYIIRLKKHCSTFEPSLLFSFISIIIICTFVMGLLSYKIVEQYLTDRIISSNNKLLNQYRRSIDLALIDTVRDFSLKVMHDVNSNYYLYRYFNEPLEHILPETMEVSKYLSSMSVLNPLVYSLSIYYSNSNLLISTDYIRHSLYRDLESQQDLSHYYNIVLKASQSEPVDEDNMLLFFDYGKNLGIQYSDVLYNKYPETIIHAVRVNYGYNRSVRCAVVVTVSGDIFKSFLDQSMPEDLGSVFIFNEDGTIISHTDHTLIGQNINELQYDKELTENRKKSGYFITRVEGIPFVVSYEPSSYSNWMYVSVTPMEAISSVSDYILKATILVALISVLIGLIVSFAETKQLAKPIKSIVDYCLRSPYFHKVKEHNEYSLISGTINNMESIMLKKEQELKKVFPTLKMNFLSSLFSDTPPELEEIRARMKVLDITFPYNFFCAAAIKLEKLKDTQNVVTYEYEKLNICSKLDEVFTTPQSKCLFYEKDNIIAVLFNFDFTVENLHQLGYRFLETTNKESPESMVILKYISFGKTDTNLVHMNTSYKIALSGLNYSYVFPEKTLYTFTDIISLEEKRSFSNKLLLNNLCNSLRSLDYDRSKSDLEGLVQALRGGDYSYQQIYNTLANCVSIVEDFICTQVGEEMSLDKGFLNTSNILEFEVWMKEVICQAFKRIESTSCDSRELVMKIQEFIEENIQNNQLSLEYVANELGINYKYLSRVFKNETGVKFIDYLTNLKLNHCRNLLLNTDLKVEEISDIMGYSTPQYFISRFKMMFGCTPKRYREKCKCEKSMDSSVKKNSVGLYYSRKR